MMIGKSQQSLLTLVKRIILLTTVTRVTTEMSLSTTFLTITNKTTELMSTVLMRKVEGKRKAARPPATSINHINDMSGLN